MTTKQIVAVLKAEAAFGDEPEAMTAAANILSRLADDKLADALGVFPTHAECKPRRLCPYCEGRTDGIDAYRREVSP